MTADEGNRMRRFSMFHWGMYYLKTNFLGMSVTSWGRSQGHNAAVGGRLDSQHLEWTAADVVWDAHQRPELPVLEAEAAKVGLEVVREVAHDHIQIARTHV